MSWQRARLEPPAAAASSSSGKEWSGVGGQRLWKTDCPYSTPAVRWQSWWGEGLDSSAAVERPSSGSEKPGAPTHATCTARASRHAWVAEHVPPEDAQENGFPVAGRAQLGAGVDQVGTAVLDDAADGGSSSSCWWGVSTWGWKNTWDGRCWEDIRYKQSPSDGDCVADGTFTRQRSWALLRGDHESASADEAPVPGGTDLADECDELHPDGINKHRGYRHLHSSSLSGSLTASCWGTSRWSCNTDWGNAWCDGSSSIRTPCQHPSPRARTENSNATRCDRWSVVELTQVADPVDHADSARGELACWRADPAGRGSYSPTKQNTIPLKCITAGAGSVDSKDADNSSRDCGSTANADTSSNEVAVVAALSEASPELLGRSLAADVEVRGRGDLPGPWLTWADVKLHESLCRLLMNEGFPAPTHIQQHAWPLACCGRDVVGIARTGSGKTLAFLLPVFSQQLGSGRQQGGTGPCLLVLAPTRELACQIEQESRKFSDPVGFRSAALYGGAPKGPQLVALRGRPDVLVATPGRLNDFLEPPPGLTHAVDLSSVACLVLDEADRMLHMGFEPQVRKVISRVPRVRQTMMFTATWSVNVQQLAADYLQNPVEVSIGHTEALQANSDITQDVLFCEGVDGKFDILLDLLSARRGRAAIVFVNTKRTCERLSCRLAGSVAIHGDRTQDERHAALALFRQGSVDILVATDVAARGLDIKGVQLVVNFDSPPREEDYIHRIGRTGRAGQKGLAVSFLTNADGGPARSIARVIERSGHRVPEMLQERLADGMNYFLAQRVGSQRERSEEPDRQQWRARSLPPRNAPCSRRLYEN